MPSNINWLKDYTLPCLNLENFEQFLHVVENNALKISF